MEHKPAVVAPQSDSDVIRRHAVEVYLAAALRCGETKVSINVGAVHKALSLNNRVPLVCAALSSNKFLKENHLRLVSKTGPPSGQSTTVTFTYEFVGKQEDDKAVDPQDTWNRLRGALKDVYAEYGGGEAYLRSERASFRDETESK